MAEKEKNDPQLDAANIITVAEMAPIVGLAATAPKADVLGKLGLLSILGALSGLVKDGKTVIADTVAAIEARVKKIEEAATKQIALLSATIDGKAFSITAEDIVRLSVRVETLEKTLREQATSTTELEKGKVLTLFAADGKVPKDADGKPYTAEGLKALDLTTLKLLHANTPTTVPLAARTRAATEGTGLDPNLKGRARFIAAQERDGARH